MKWAVKKRGIGSAGAIRFVRPEAGGQVVDRLHRRELKAQTDFLPWLKIHTCGYTAAGWGGVNVILGLAGPGRPQ